MMRRFPVKFLCCKGSMYYLVITKLMGMMGKRIRGDDLGGRCPGRCDDQGDAKMQGDDWGHDEKNAGLIRGTPRFTRDDWRDVAQDVWMIGGMPRVKGG